MEDSAANRHSSLLQRSSTVLVVIDMQPAFLKAMYEPERLESNVLLLVQAAAIMGVPVLVTTQNAGRLGGIAPSVSDVLPKDVSTSFDKLSFSCAGSPGFMTALQGTGRRQVVICGLETHICVGQTAADLHHRSYQVHVAADAVTSRTLEKHKLGMERIRDIGVLPCAAEAAVYELLADAGAAEFKAILPLVR